MWSFMARMMCSTGYFSLFILLNFAIFFVNLIYLRWNTIKALELRQHINEVEMQKAHPINLTWEAASKMYDNARAYRDESRKLRDEWKFAKMLSDVNHDPRDLTNPPDGKS